MHRPKRRFPYFPMRLILMGGCGLRFWRRHAKFGCHRLRKARLAVCGLRTNQLQAPLPTTAQRTRGAGRPSREEGAEIRQRIFAEAMAEFVDRGFHGASIASIAARSGVSRITVYKHFESKEQLLRMLSDHYSDRLRNALEQAIDDQQPCWAVLMNVGRCFFREDQYDDSRAISRIMIMEADRLPEIASRGIELRRKVLDPLTNYLERMALQGKLTVEKPALTALHFLNIATSSVDFLFSSQKMSEEDREKYLTTAVKTFLYGIDRGRN